MLDFSAAMPLRMAQEGLDWPDLDAIWISHFHLDHCAGLLPFLAGTKHAPQMKNRTKPLRVFGPNPIRNLIAKFSDVNNYKLLEQPFPIEIVGVGHNDKFEILTGVEAVACKSPHTAESHAIHIRDMDDKTLVYSSDTGFDDLIAAFANRANLFILECTFLRDKPIQKHIELAEAIYLIRKSGCKQAMLTHFYPEWDAVDFESEVAKIAPDKNILQAADGMVVIV